MKRFPHARSWPAFPLLFALTCLACGQEQKESEFDWNETLSLTEISKLLEKSRDARRPKLDTDILKNLIKNLPKNLDPTLLGDKEIKKLLQDIPDLKDPQKLAQLQDVIQQLMKNPKQLQELSKMLQGLPDVRNAKGGEIDWKSLGKALGKLEDYQRKTTAGPKVNEPVEPPSPPKNDAPIADKPPPSDNSKQMEQLSRWLFGDSPTMKNLAGDLTKELAEVMSKDTGIPDLATEFAKEWKALKARVDVSGPKFSLNQFGSGLSLPDVKSGSSFASGPSLPSESGSFSGGPSSGGGGGDSDSFILLALLAAAALGLLLLARRRRTPESEGMGEEPLRVPPHEVRSRTDVIKAFECLSLLKCGADAVNWHHHQIAEAIGGREPDGREAAGRLADLYEKARYAPLNDLFTEGEIAEARERLRQLVEAPAR